VHKYWNPLQLVIDACIEAASGELQIGPVWLAVLGNLGFQITGYEKNIVVWFSIHEFPIKSYICNTRFLYLLFSHRIC